MSNETLFAQAAVCIPGGVNSPVRSFGQVGGTPIFIDRGDGAYLVDSEGRCYIDYIGSWGCLILGHDHPEVRAAVLDAVPKGLGFGAPTQLETEMATLIHELMPSIEKVRMVNSGTEATLSALRLARGIQKRDKFIKFEGAYHGHSDSLLVSAGSGALGLNLPDSPGVPESAAQHTLIARYNDLDSVVALFEQHPNEISAIMVEPISGNMNCVPPIEGFLQGLRDVCDHYNALLIFDEVMTGFRVALGGAQALYGIKPDLTCLGKIVGGGLPVGAFGGRAELMDHLAPEGTIYQAGTLSGNPITLSAGLSTLKHLQAHPEHYTKLEAYTRCLLEGLRTRAEAHNIALRTHQVGSMFGLLFNELDSIQTFQDVKQSNTQHYQSFFHGMLNEGCYFAPSAFEAGFVSVRHQHHELEATLMAAEKILSNGLD